MAKRKVSVNKDLKHGTPQYQAYMDAKAAERKGRGKVGYTRKGSNATTQKQISRGSGMGRRSQ